MDSTDSGDLEISMDDFLEHYGVKGMRWGVRKKQERATKSEDYIRARELKRKPRSSLSNADLKFLNERLNLEQNSARLNPNKVKKGREFAKELVATVGVITSVLALTQTEFGKSAIKTGKDVVWGNRFNDMVNLP